MVACLNLLLMGKHICKWDNMHFFFEEISGAYLLLIFLLGCLLLMRLPYSKDIELLSLAYIRIFYHGAGLVSSVCAHFDVLVSGRVSSN